MIFSRRALLSMLLSQLPVPALSQGAGDCVEAGLVSWWKGENNADDSAGDNDGTFLGDYTYGQVGQAFDFDGTDDEVQVADDASLGLTTSYSFQTWIKNDRPVASNDYSPIAIRGSGATGVNSDDIEIYVQSGTNDLVVAHNRGTTGTFDYVGFSDPPRGSWFHLIVTYNSTVPEVKAYYNGTAQDVVNEDASLETPSYTNKPWVFGVGYHSAYQSAGSTYPPFFLGIMDEVAIYDYALSQEQVTRIYNQGVCEASSPPSSMPSLSCPSKYDELMKQAHQFYAMADELVDEAADLDCAPCKGKGAKGCKKAKSPKKSKQSV